MTYSFAPSNDPLFVAEGDLVQFQFQAPLTWNTTETITVQIGDLTQFWYITTIPEDFTPDPFPFQRYEGAELDTLYTYADGTRTGEEIVVVSGLTPTTQAAVYIAANVSGGIDTYAMRIDYDGDGTFDTGWFQPTSLDAITVENGARIQIRGRSSIFSNDETRITVVIGTSSEVWVIQTVTVPLNEPIPFPTFDSLTGLDILEVAYSNIVQINGLTTDAAVSLTGGADYGISNTNSTTVNGDGYAVLTGADFDNPPATISNGQFLQLRLTASEFANTPALTSVSIGDIAGGSSWTITTGSNPSETPGSFSFTDQTGVPEDTLIASDPAPPGGLTGLDLPVEAVLVSTTSTDVRIKVNSGSVTTLPVTVENGDVLTLYQQSSPDFDGVVSTVIQVGTRVISSWDVITNSGPDYDALFTPPSNLTNQIPDTFVTSSSVSVTDINRPITITATNGALISIDFGTFTASPVTFDPSVNTSFRLGLLTSTSLNTLESTDVVVGTEALDVPSVSFTWETTTYAVAPPPPSYRGVWYSKKSEKFDGYPIGTVLPVFKENIIVSYGNLSGENDSRYPGFVSCDGTEYDVTRFPHLWDVIGNTYGGDGAYDENTKTYSGVFNVPDYRNRRLAGTGFVDGTRASSAGLPVDTIGKSIYDVGAEGGYWYFDRVDASGPNPLEQVIGTSSNGGVITFALFWSNDYVNSNGTQAPTGGDGGGSNTYFPSNTGTASYRADAGQLFSGPTDVITRDEDMVGGSGSGCRMRITYEAYPSTVGGGTYDTIIRIDAILDPGIGYQVGDELSTDYWNANPAAANTIVRVDSITSSSSPSGFESEFFTLGSIRMTGLETLTTEVIFDIEGTVSAQVGPLTNVLVATPEHDHFYLAAVVETEDGDPLNPWGPEGRALFRTGNTFEEQEYGAGIDNGGSAGNLGGASDYSDELAYEFWEQFITNNLGSNFVDELRKYDPAYGNLSNFINLLPVGAPPGPGNNTNLDVEIDFLTYWASPDSTLEPVRNAGQLRRVDPSDPTSWLVDGEPLDTNQRQVSAVIDTEPTNFTISSYTPPTGQTYPHRHLITVDPVTDPNTDFTGGNIIGEGSSAPGFGSGLGNANTQLQIVFSQDTANNNPVFMDMTEGTFRFLGNFKSPVPVAVLRPQKQAPIINPFHKTKYVIKAY